jgi:putative Holliday junction resolvase
MILALDPGEKRVGVAATDPAGLTAQPLTVIPRKPHGLFLQKIQDLAKERESQLILLGLPRRTDGRLGPEAQKALSLAHELKIRLKLPVATWEEWMTTAQAQKILIEGQASRQERRQAVDKTAATLILESYLDHLKKAKPSLTL